MSSSVTGVDVVGADHRPGELLRDEVQLIGRTGAREQAERVRTMELTIAAEAFGRAIKRLIPRGWPQYTVVADERLSESSVVLLPLFGHARPHWIAQCVSYTTNHRDRGI